MNNINIKLLWIYNAKLILKRVFYQLGLKLWQFVSEATDLWIDFQKLECEYNSSGYKSTCTNKETIDGKRLSRGRELVQELDRGGSRLTSLGWVGSGLGWAIPARAGHVGLAGARLGCIAWPAALVWFGHGWPMLGCVRRPGFDTDSELARKK